MWPRTQQRRCLHVLVGGDLDAMRPTLDEHAQVLRVPDVELTGALLAVTALFFWWLTREWTEAARARFDMDRTWRQRRNYRLRSDERA